MPRPGRTSSRQQEKWRKAAHQQRREMIVDVAMELLARKGVDAITMRSLAVKLGVGAMTLYTYFENQDALHVSMIQRGFDMLNNNCRSASEAHLNEDDARAQPAWQAGARSYVKFAVENPALYHLMFSMPFGDHAADRQVIDVGFAPLRECVRQQMANKGLSEKEIKKELPMAVARFWIALHGLASLAISGRLVSMGKSIDPYIDDLLSRVAPT